MRKGAINSHQTRNPSAEFIALISALSAIGALSTDAIMPALPQMAQELGALTENSRQLPISAFFLGSALGQVLYGPIADSQGRKPALYLGLGIYLLGCLMAALAQDFQFLLLSRLVQGFGVASARTIPMALVRDEYSGRRMARVMSYTQTVFILVPMLAPSYGQVILALGNWRTIFASFTAIGALLLLWFATRQPETLPTPQRTPLQWRTLWATLNRIVRQRTVLGYTLIAGLISGAFGGYLNTAQQLYAELYGLGSRFSLYFALVAFALGTASLVNSQLVMKLGMHRIATTALWWVVTCGLVGLAVSTSQLPPLWFLLTYLMLSFFGVGLLFGNINALAMQPLGQHAGIGASLVGSLSTLLSVPIGTLIGQRYNHTPQPLMIGLVITSALSLLLMHWISSENRA